MTPTVAAPRLTAVEVSERQSPMIVPLLAFLGFAMTILPYAIVSSDPGVWQFGATLAFIDFVAFGLAIVGVRRFFERIRSRQLHSVEWAGLGLLAVLTVTLALHPSLRGIVLVVRLGCCLTIADLIGTTESRNRVLLIKGLGAASAAQCLIAVAQRITGSALGLGALGETAIPFRPGYPVPTGTMRDAYPLAAFGLFVAALTAVALTSGWIWGRFAWVVLGSGGVLAGLSGSRTALLTVAAIFGACCITRAAPRNYRGLESTGEGVVEPGQWCLTTTTKVSLTSSTRRTLGVGAVVVLAFGICAAFSSPLWLRRTTNISTSGGGVVVASNDVTNGRSALTEQALGLFRNHPFVGVGPGNYSTALRATPELARKSPENQIQPVHNMVLMALTESGLLVVPALLAVFVTLGRLVVRTRRSSLPLFAAIVPFLMLDLVFWFYPEGLVMVAIAIGFAISSAADQSN